MKNKIFDAVEYMRKTRDRLSKKYLKHPQEEERDLARIREKYRGFKRTAANTLKKVKSK